MARAFISYKWQDDTHNQWVYKFYNDLRTKKGIDARIDKFEVALGDSFVEYMARGIQESDYFLFIITPEAVDAVERSKGGVYFELQMAVARQISGDLIKLIPIYREGDTTPTYLRSHRYIDFRDDRMYEQNLAELAKSLRGEVKPPATSTAGKPIPLIADMTTLQTKAELYLACALVAKAGQDGTLSVSDIRKKLSAFRYVRIDSGSLERLDHAVIFLAYLPDFTRPGTIKELWVKVGTWPMGEEAIHLTQKLGALMSETRQKLS